MLSSRSVLFTLASASLVSAALLGCASPEDRFNEYIDRDKQVRENATSSSSGGGGGGDGGAGGGAACLAPAAGEPDGDFLFALAASLSPNTPVVFLANVTTAANGDGITLSITVQPLKATDRKTLTGDAGPLDPITVAADGSFTAKLPPLPVPGDANPITGNDFVAEVELTGTMCAPGDFICGTLTGNVTQPSMIPLDGSTFTFQKITDANNYPVALKNCARDEAPL